MKEEGAVKERHLMVWLLLDVSMGVYTDWMEVVLKDTCRSSARKKA